MVELLILTRFISQQLLRLSALCATLISLIAFVFYTLLLSEHLFILRHSAVLEIGAKLFKCRYHILKLQEDRALTVCNLVAGDAAKLVGEAALIC